MEWPAVRPILQGMVPRNYWTALECHDDGAWTAYTPGLPVDGGMTIAGSRSAAYFEAQRRIAVTIRNMYEVGQRVPPQTSAMSLSAAQAWDSSHREVFEMLDEDMRERSEAAPAAPKIVERQWRQVHVDLSLADDSPTALDRAELRDALRERNVRNIWASDPESEVDEEEEEGEGDEEVDADEEDDEMLDIANDEHGIVATEPPGQGSRNEASTSYGMDNLEGVEDGAQPVLSALGNWASAEPWEAPPLLPREQRTRRPRSDRGEGRLEALAGMVASGGALAMEAGVHWGAGMPDRAAGQQPGLRMLEHREEEEDSAPPPRRSGAAAEAQPGEVDERGDRLQRREQATRTTRRHMERQRSFTRLYNEGQRGGVGRPLPAQHWREAEGSLC
ncbi:hypothetical protein CVIRNUC_000909 [Coccomyxa viridis]|uniref:Uncharacterized protein n=1 Tax=Coccomyxa viridis TaxID=1274662 RepID=A0AAV1HT74_9CHLO|nr:hypothetical protein CVIRNUC_000909 [Coccomyxa viridis]